jgi:hypothetical protein
MSFKIQHIIPPLAVSLLIACTAEENGLPTNMRGSFTLGLSTDSLAVEVTTRAGRNLTDAEQQIFTVSLTQNGETIWENIPYADITQDDRIQPVGNGYVVSAESCTSSDAESANNGWGQRRYWGQSDSFDIKSGENTEVSVDCRMANAGLCVEFDESFTSYFTMGYSVTTDDSRTLRFDNTTSGSVAYYNIPEGNTRMVHLLVNASAGWDGTLHIERDLVLTRGGVTRLHVRKSESTEGQIDLGITFDDEFDVQYEYIDVPLED